MHNSNYLIECKDFHSNLLNLGRITLDEIPQYVRIVEGISLYIAGYKETAYRHINDKDVMPWLIDFFKIVNDDCLAVNNFESLHQILKYDEMINIMESLLQDMEWDYGKNTRIAIESTIEKSLLQAVRTYRDTRETNIKAKITKRLSEKRT